MNFTGQVALVTGGSGGIGRAIVHMLAERGGCVVAGYHRNAEAAEALVTSCAELPGSVVAQQIDVRSRESADALVDVALVRWGQIDILINCAGVAAYAPITELSSEQW